MPAGRVLATQQAHDAAKQLLALVGRVKELITRLRQQGDILADPNRWDCGLAGKWRHNWDVDASQLRQAAAKLDELERKAQQVIDDIFGADSSPPEGSQATGSAADSYAGSGNRVPLPQGTLITKDGAFQPGIRAGDYNSLDLPDKLALQPFYYEMGGVPIAMAMMFGPNSANFFGHYLQNSGDDLNFNSLHPYQGSTNFANLVDGTAATQISQAQARGVKTFDSDWIYDAVPGKSGKPGNSTSPFTDNQDWNNAIGKGYYRLTGYQAADGTWHTNLRMTSYYDFHPGQNFLHGLLKGKDLHGLHQAGLAKNFREIGNGTLQYDSNGNPLTLRYYDPIYPPPQPLL